jgi:hypothetical protein
MKTSRLEAFSDGVLAIIITIMVLELKVPHSVELAALKPVLPVLLSYCAELYLPRHLLEQPSSFIPGHAGSQRRDSVGQSSSVVLAVALSIHHSLDGRKPPRRNPDRYLWLRVADGGNCLLCTAANYYRERHESLVAQAIGKDWKGKLSPLLYLAAIPLAFVSSWIAGGLYVFAALLWLIPDPRIEREIEKREE